MRWSHQLLCRDKIFMVMQLVTGGDLFDRVVAHGPMKASRSWRAKVALVQITLLLGVH